MPIFIESIKMSKTAIITGASSGIGRSFARQLAADGYNMILVARRENVLNEVKNELESRFSVNAEIFTADLSKMDDLRRLEEKIQLTPDLEFLINSAGFGGGWEKRYPDVDRDSVSRIITVHCIATARLSQAAAEVMKERGKGYIINLASVAAFGSYPGAANYTSTKQFILSFTRNLGWDLKGTGVRVQALCPGFVKTDFYKTEEMIQGMESYKRIPRFLWLDVDWLTKKSIAKIKRSATKYVYIPSIRYKILARLLRWIF